MNRATDPRRDCSNCLLLDSFTCQDCKDYEFFAGSCLKCGHQSCNPFKAPCSTCSSDTGLKKNWVPINISHDPEPKDE